MSTTHTPGPWLCQPGRGARPIRLKRDHWEVGVAKDGGEGVALVFREEANARLIAAAPDLYAACKQALHWFNEDAEHSGYEHERMVEEQLLLAVAKAEGRSNA